MASKKEILNKIRILLSQKFDTPQKAFEFFDDNQSGSLTKVEIKNMLEAAEISGFLNGIVTNQLIKGLDLDQSGDVTWGEFRDEVEKLMN